ncbi:fez family zinc finger protein 2-like isoform X8 [Diabrotica virgifera virgifera]|nr:fez family zinc finger protein 2-like isoform X8 [Diabrotica virgifera virgifera]
MDTSTGTVIYNPGPYSEHQATTSRAEVNRADFVDDRTCEICNKVLSTHYALKRHRKIHRNRAEDDHRAEQQPTTPRADDNCRADFVANRTCDICKKVLSTHYALKRHLKIHAKDKRSRSCQICGAQFLTVYALGVHKNHQHEGNIPKCDICEKQFSTNYHLKRHM